MDNNHEKKSETKSIYGLKMNKNNFLLVIAYQHLYMRTYILYINIYTCVLIYIYQHLYMRTYILYIYNLLNKKC